jgi:hypothetical protein
MGNIIANGYGQFWIWAWINKIERITFPALLRNKRINAYSVDFIHLLLHEFFNIQSNMKATVVTETNAVIIQQ